MWSRATHPRGKLAVLFAVALATAGGCSHGGRGTIPTQPFRDESDPSGGFQYEESAVPAGAEGTAKSATESAGETTVEVEIDDEGGEGTDTAASGDTSEQGDDEAGDDGEDDGGGGDDGGDGGEDIARGGAGDTVPQP